MDRDFKGVWIPKEIWLAENISHSEKFLLVEIHSLENINGCYATNDHFSKMLGVSKDRVSRLISSLKEKGYITIQIIYKENSKEVEKRIIKTVLENRKIEVDPIGENTNTPRYKYQYPLGENTNTPIGENTKENNTVLDIQESIYITPLTPLGENEGEKTPNEKNGDEKKQAMTKAFVEEQLCKLDSYPALKGKIREWLEYKDERRQKYKPKGLQGLISQAINSARSYGEAATMEAVDYAIANNYQGILWDYVRKKGAPHANSNPAAQRPRETSRNHRPNESPPPLGITL